jgi:hypothetical protein
MHYQEITEHYVQKADCFSKKAFLSPSYQSTVATRNQFMKKERKRIEWQVLNPILFILGLSKTFQY